MCREPCREYVERAGTTADEMWSRWRSGGMWVATVRLDERRRTNTRVCVIVVERKGERSCGGARGEVSRPWNVEICRAQMGISSASID